MYDNIRLLLKNPFTDNQTRDAFCTRFELETKNEKLNIYHNKGSSNLSQNKGIFLKLTENSLSIRFSLHKFYNYDLYGKPFNHNDFDFKEAKKAAEKLRIMFASYFDIMQATVKEYEVGANVITSDDPDIYLKELKQINIHGRVLRITDDVYYKEYKQYSTNREKDKRIIYIFYNKTFEARSKAKEADRPNIPANVLRFEKDNKRPVEKIKFNRMFENDFIQLTVKEFEQRFTNDLEYKGMPEKPENMTRAEHNLLCLIHEKGTDGAKAHLKIKLSNGRVKKSYYYETLRMIDKINNILPSVETTVTKHAAELNNLIINKIHFFRKYGLF